MNPEIVAAELAAVESLAARLNGYRLRAPLFGSIRIDWTARGAALRLTVSASVISVDDGAPIVVTLMRPLVKPAAGWPAWPALRDRGIEMVRDGILSLCCHEIDEQLVGPDDICVAIPHPEQGLRLR